MREANGRVVNGIARPEWNIEVPRGVRGLMPLGGGGLAPLGVANKVTAPHWATLGGTIADSHIAAWTPKGAASLAASYVQYGTLGTGLTVGVAPTLSNGWVFNGSSQYLKSGVIATSNQVYSLAVQFSGGGSAGAVVAALTTTGGFCILLYPSFVGNRYYANFNSLAITGGSVTSGNLIVAGTKGYYNGTQETGTIGASGGGVSTETYIGARNTGSNTPAFYWSGTIIAVAFYDLTLNLTQAGQLAAAMAAL